MGLEPLLGESFGRARPWDPAQLPVVPRTPRHPAAPLWVLGAVCVGVCVAGQGRAQQQKGPGGSGACVSLRQHL